MASASDSPKGVPGLFSLSPQGATGPCLGDRDAASRGARATPDRTPSYPLLGLRGARVHLVTLVRGSPCGSKPRPHTQVTARRGSPPRRGCPRTCISCQSRGQRLQFGPSELPLAGRGGARERLESAGNWAQGLDKPSFPECR